MGVAYKSNCPIISMDHLDIMEDRSSGILSLFLRCTKLLEVEHEL